MTDELDGFITRHSDEDNWAVFLPAILDNLELPIPSTSSDAHDPAQPPINTATNLPVNTTAINTPATSLRAAEVFLLHTHTLTLTRPFVQLCIHVIYMDYLSITRCATVTFLSNFYCSLLPTT